MKLRQFWLSCGIAGLILGGVIADRALFQVPASDSFPYHERVKQAETKVPASFGDWEAEDIEVPTEAQKLLRSNVLISRKYKNTMTNQHANFLLVQCSDARNLSGHFPPICYPNSGYTKVSEDPSAEEITAPGMAYTFKQETLNGTQSMHVYNVMILPDNQTAVDMSGVNRIARDRRLRAFGAAEIQVLTDVDMPEKERTQIINMLLAHYKPLIDEIRSGVVQ